LIHFYKSFTDERQLINLQASQMIIVENAV